MRFVTIKRMISTERATLGVLLIDDRPICFTLEPTLQDPEEFCIPAGQYRLVRVVSARFGNCFTVIGVPGHDLLRIHWGNGPDDTEGCPLVGLQIDATDGGHIWASKAAFKLFMEAMRDVKETSVEFINCFSA